MIMRGLQPIGLQLGIGSVTVTAESKYINGVFKSCLEC
jgi:hypothetical protein